MAVTARHQTAAAPHPDASPIHVGVIRTEHEFRELAADWSQLLAESERDTIFLTHAWHQAWWDCFNAGRRMHVLTVRRDGELLAIAPLCVEPATFRWLPVKRLSFMANSQTCESGFIACRGHGEAVRAALTDLASQRKLWDWIDLRRVLDGSATATDLARAAGDVGLRTFWRPDLRVPYIPIRGTWQQFLAGRSRNFRRGQHHQDNRLASDGRPFCAVRLTSQADIQAALPAVADIIRRSWKGGDSRRQIEHRFDRALVDRLGPLGWVNLWLLRCQGIPIAFEFHLVYRGVTAALRAGFDQSLARLSPGAYLERLIIRSLFDDPERRIVEYNTCAGNYPYTRRWTDNVRDYARVWAFRRGGFGTVLSFLGKFGRSIALPDRPPAVRSPLAGEADPF